MNTRNAIDELDARATDALRTLLGQISVIKLKAIRREAKGSMLAHIDVLGHSHTLACEVIRSNARPENMRDALRHLHDLAGGDRSATPVLIATYMPPEAQALCKENQTGFLDLEGNARLTLGEVFIGRRALTHRAPVAPAAAPRLLSTLPRQRLRTPSAA